MKEKSIIKKLGITPGPWKHSDGMGYIFADRIGGCTMKMQNMTVANTRGYGCLQYHGEEKAHAEMEANETLIAAAPELLEALMISVLHDFNYFLGFFGKFEDLVWLKHKCELKWNEPGLEVYYDFERSLKALEKATGKSWEEIKELL